VTNHDCHEILEGEAMIFRPRQRSIPNAYR
jgi:hypothetical protein